MGSSVVPGQGNRTIRSEKEIIEIFEGNISHLHEIYKKMHLDFPPNEIKPYAHLKKLMENNKYKLILAKHKGADLIVGYAFIYDITQMNIVWLDYIAIDKGDQNMGYGSLLFKAIAGMPAYKDAGILLEVEIPSENEM